MLAQINLYDVWNDTFSNTNTVDRRTYLRDTYYLPIRGNF